MYLGSSLVFCAIYPYVLDEINGKNNFTRATNSQPLNGTYYILKEVNKKHDTKRVCIALSHDMMISGKGDYKEESSLYMNWRNTDFMEVSFNKLEYVFCMSVPANYAETLLPFTRYRDKLLNVGYIIGNIKRKSDENYKPYEYFSENKIGEIVKYGYKGEFYSTEVISDEELSQIVTDMDMKDFPITDISKKYLKKLLSFVRKMISNLYFLPCQCQLVELCQAFCVDLS